MIHPKSLSAEWIQAKIAEMKSGDPGLLEKTIHAFALLGHLAESGLDFVFKGGTSVLLHVPVIRRLSIDIDILCAAPKAQLDRIVQEIAGKPPFLGVKEDARGARGLPNRRHFRFFFKPLLANSLAPYVILDVVEETKIPHRVVAKPIMAPFLEITREVTVNLPNVENLLADKLTAFAPNTVGIPFHPPGGRSADTMQIVKQLFDIGELAPLAVDMNEVRHAYNKIFALENGYRENRFQKPEALQDTLNVALHLSRHDFRGVPTHPDAKRLEEGRRGLQSHIVNHRFDLNAAKTAAAKTGLIASIVAAGDSGKKKGKSLGKIPAPQTLEALNIVGPWEKLNRLKQANPEAFYYWHQASVMKKHDG